ncbi:OR13A protein, partial [Acromyrmex charruanus]
MLNSDKVKACLNKIQKDWQSLNSVEKVILERHSKYGQHLATFYAVLMHTTASLFVVKPIMLTLMTDDIINITKSSIPFESRLPFRVEYGRKFNQYIYPIAVHSYVAVVAHSFATVVADALYYTLIQHACGMFSIIGNVLENIGKNDTDEFDTKSDKIKDDNYYKTLHCLRRHLGVIEFAEHIESVYTKIFLINLNFNMIIGSLYGIQMLINFDKNVNDIVAPISMYFGQLIHLFLHFWQGQFLLDYSILPYESINTLENIGKNNEENFDAKLIKVKDDNYSKTLHCLRRHIIAIEFAEHIESLFTKIFLITLNLNMISSSITGIQVLMNLDKGANDITGPITIYVAQLIHLFLLFWQGQFLLDYSVLPYESICKANWYYTSQRCRKLLLLMMYKTAIPCRITAGKLMILSIDNFAMVVKTSLSYLTVFRSMQ